MPAHRQSLKLKEVALENFSGKIIARESKTNNEKAEEETLTFDAATRIWRGREKLEVADLIADGIWSAKGKKSLDDQAVLLGITWKPTLKNIFTRFHISDIWLMPPPCNVPPETKPKRIKPISAAAGCPADRRSTASLAPPPSPPHCSAWTNRSTPILRRTRLP